jgi:predicted RNA-binding protein associated with RNAse of E/G family
VLALGDEVTVRLVKMSTKVVEYPVTVVSDDGTHLVVCGPWAEPTARDVGFAVFEPGDMFTEHYWRDRWYSIKEVRDGTGSLKGWYCDVTRPMRVDGSVIISLDLELDLWVSADGLTVLRLDEDEFDASGLATTDPAAARRALHALASLETLAGDGFSALLGRG